MTSPTDDQLATLSAALDRFVRRHKLVDASNSDRPLNELDKQALLYVADNIDCGPTDVARFLRLALTTVSSAIQRLVKRGLLERHRAEDDRRAIALRLSTQGQTLVVAQLEAHRATYLMMLNPLSPAERKVFLDLIHKIGFNDG